MCNEETMTLLSIHKRMEDFGSAYQQRRQKPVQKQHQTMGPHDKTGESEFFSCSDYHERRIARPLRHYWFCGSVVAMNWKYNVCNTQDPELRLLHIHVPPMAERFCISNKTTN
jgi:hypothetical protein